MPLSCIVYNKKLGGIPHSGTFRGNQLAFALGTVVFEKMINDKILENVLKCEKILREELSELIGTKEITDIRIQGLLMGIEMKTTDHATNFFNKLLDNNLICKQGGRHNKTLIFWIALNIQEDDLNKIILTIKETIKDL